VSGPHSDTGLLGLKTAAAQLRVTVAARISRRPHMA
jgi:hypothetical protein